MSTLLHGPETGEFARPVDAAADPNPGGPGGSPRRRPNRARDLRRWLLLGALGIAAVLVGMHIGLRLAHPGVLPGVSLAGTQVGGMDRGQLRAHTERLAASVEADPVTVSYDQTLAALLPADVAYDVDVHATTQAAWAVGRTGNPVTDTWAHLQALWSVRTVPLVDTADTTALDAWVAQVADTIDRQVGNGGLLIDPDTLQITIDPPTAGYATRRTDLTAAVRQALSVPGARQVSAPVDVTPVTVDVDSVRDVAARAEDVLRTDTSLSVDGVTVTLTPRQVAPLLTLETDGDDARLAVSAEAIETGLADLADRLTIAPVNARFDLPRAPVTTLDDKGDTSFAPIAVEVTIVPGTPGRQFDAIVVADAMSTAYRNGTNDVTVDLPQVQPEVTTEALQALNVTHLLGTFTTYYQPGQPRVVNIRHLADVLDGAIVRPGEQFSINRRSGERTCDKGYTRDGMIYNGELIKVCGGGVSQVGTAVFNAAFFAGVQIDQHKPHSWYISRYPKGREATLDYDTDIDVKFTNDTGNGIVLRTHHSPEHLTVSLYGSSDVTRVRAIHGREHNPRQPPVRYVEDPTLPPGTEQVVDRGHDGFDIDVTRAIERDGTTQRQTWSHRYVTSPRIVHRNSQEPSPSPAPSPAPSDGAGSEGPSGETSPSPSPSPSREGGTSGGAPSG